MSSLRFAVFADDLTGAADSGVQLVRAGYLAATFFQGEPVNASGLEVVALDTDSRALSPAEARKRVIEAVDAAGRSEFVFKKVDSTLRGNLAAEVEAALEATGRERAVVAPAFPGGGRTTEGGIQCLHGQPVHRTKLARDRKTPVTEDHLPSLLSGLGPVETLDLDEVQKSSTVARALERGRCVVADATEDLHLSTLVRAVPEPSDVLWVGSAGLSGALGEAYPGPHPIQVPAYNLARTTLVVVGSLSQVSREQLRVLSESSGVVAIELSGKEGAKRFAREDIESAIARAGEAFADGSSVALAPSVESGSLSSEGVAEGLANVVSGLEADSFGALVLTGGDTAVAVARALGATGIWLLGEIEAGVPIGRLVGPRPYPVVTKAGGFGDGDTLSKALKIFTGDREVN